MKSEPFILHIGCGPFLYHWARNTDIDREGEENLDITKKWPMPDNFVDAIVSMHVFQCLTAHELVFALSEAYRVLKVGGVMRFGVPLIESRRPLSQILGWSNQILFSKDLLKYLLEHIGFIDFEECKYQQGTSIYQQLTEADNRPDETYFFEAYK